MILTGLGRSISAASSPHTRVRARTSGCDERALRAILKATQFCAAEPEKAARLVADKGHRCDYALQTMEEVHYARGATDAETPSVFLAAATRSGHDQIHAEQDHWAGCLILSSMISSAS